MTGRTSQIGGLNAYVWDVEGPPLAASRDASDLVGEAFSASAELVVVPVERLGPDFLRLSSGLAGEVLQKFVNYGLKIAILGDVSAALAAAAPCATSSTNPTAAAASGSRRTCRRLRR